MGFINSVYVFTIVINIIVINDHKSDANYCIEQITGDGKLNKNSNGEEAFKYAYHHLAHDDFELHPKECILNNYFENHLSNVLKVDPPETPLSPIDWKKKNCPGSPITPFLGNINNFDEAKKETYFRRTKEELEDAEYFYADDGNKGYNEYIFNTLLSLVPNAHLLEPLQFCENYTVSTCETQIEMIENMDINFTGKEAFYHIYYNFNYVDYSREIDILHQYTLDLFHAADPVNTDSYIPDPNTWCLYGYSELEDMDISIKEDKCDDLINSSMFFNEEATESALTRAYFELKEIHLEDDFTKSYCSFMINQILTSVNFSDATIPRKYCETHFQPFENISNDN